MRCLARFLALSPSLLLWSLTLLSAHEVASRQIHTSPPSPLIFRQPPCIERHDKRWARRLRDAAIEIIWRIPPHTHSNGAHPSPSDAILNPPTSLLARYGGDVVLRFVIRSAEEAAAFAEAVNVLLLDVWEFNSEWVDIRLSKDVVPSLLGLLPPSLQHAHTPLMHDLAQTIYESSPSPSHIDPSPQTDEPHRAFSPNLSPTPSQTNIFFRDYQPLSVIIPWMRLLRSLFPTHVRLLSIGLTYEGRDIPALRVGVHPTNSDAPLPPRKTILVTGGSHAREWISTSSVNYVAYALITAYGKDQGLTKLLEKFDFVFIPTLNPDGYVYTWETDRLWRKNRQETSLRFCKGVDLDRAYSFQWDVESTSNNPCSESFSGEAPFDATEARRLATWAKNETENNNAEFVGFLDLHSYSQQVLYPYSYSCTSTPPSLENLEELAIGLAKSIRLTHGEIYGVTSACEGSVMSHSPGSSKAANIHYPRIESAGGSALDWFYHEMNVSYAYQVKLRDTGSYGFLLPRENIVPQGKEVLAAVRYFGDFLSGDKGIEEGEGEGKAPGRPSGVSFNRSDDEEVEEVQELEDDVQQELSIGELRRRRK